MFVGLKTSRATAHEPGSDFALKLLLVALALLVPFALVGEDLALAPSWPGRAYVLLAQRLPMALTSVFERSRTLDPYGRLLRDGGKIEVQCPRQTARTAVLLIAGQSNAANSGAERFSTRHPDRVVNFSRGRCYAAASPLLGATGTGGEVWTLAADRLIESGTFDAVVLAPVAVGASAVEEWAKGGALNMTMTPLVNELTARYRVTHVLWHQGETDFGFRTDGAVYCDRVLSFVGTLRAHGIDAPVYVSQATRCGPGWMEANPIRAAQQALASGAPGFRAGVDTDALLDAKDRNPTDGCHFARSGQMKTAEARAEILSR